MSVRTTVAAATSTALVYGALFAVALTADPGKPKTLADEPTKTAPDLHAAPGQATVEPTAGAEAQTAPVGPLKPSGFPVPQLVREGPQIGVQPTGGVAGKSAPTPPAKTPARPPADWQRKFAAPPAPKVERHQVERVEPTAEAPKPPPAAKRDTVKVFGHELDADRPIADAVEEFTGFDLPWPWGSARSFMATLADGPVQVTVQPSPDGSTVTTMTGQMTDDLEVTVTVETSATKPATGPTTAPGPPRQAGPTLVTVTAADPRTGAVIGTPETATVETPEQADHAAITAVVDVVLSATDGDPQPSVVPPAPATAG